MTFDEVIKAIKDAVGDFTTLDVVTLTGEIKITSSVADGGKKIDLKKLYQEIASKAESDLQVVAFTHIDFDCDSVCFVKKEYEVELLEAHRKMVETAQQTRQAVIDMLKAIATELV